MEGIAERIRKLAHDLCQIQSLVQKRLIDRIFEALQEENIIEIRTEIICIDSTSIKVHPDAAGARKSSGEQNIGRSKGGSQQRFIWLPRLRNMQ